MQEYLSAQQKKNIKLLELEEKTKKITLQEWLNMLPEEQLLEFVKDYTHLQGVPEKVYQTSKRKKALALAEEYFNTVLWPQKFKQILNAKEQLNQIQDTL